MLQSDGPRYTDRAVRTLERVPPGGPVRLTVVATAAADAAAVASLFDRPEDALTERAPRVYDLQTTLSRVDALAEGAGRGVVEVFDGPGRVYGAVPVAAGAQVPVRVVVEDGEPTSAQREALAAGGLDASILSEGSVEGVCAAEHLVEVVLAGLLVEVA